ncbi:MAG: hypothetical protein GY752_00870 [bacterium]|nr:hypothetical protein [bacterium]MCP4798449.1 hypothetical protein [bacterium]
MKFQFITKASCVIFLLLLVANPVWSQDANQQESKKTWLLYELSEKDLILPVTSVEWGAPDRWSFTSRYFHKFGKARHVSGWRHHLGATLSPGTDGGRLGIGYTGLFTIESKPDFAFFTEARAVLLRTWGNPLSTDPNHTFVGAELRVSVVLINLGVGYYKHISDSNVDLDDFIGFHVGFGI